MKIPYPPVHRQKREINLTTALERQRPQRTDARPDRRDAAGAPRFGRSRLARSPQRRLGSAASLRDARPLLPSRPARALSQRSPAAVLLIARFSARFRRLADLRPMSQIY